MYRATIQSWSTLCSTCFRRQFILQRRRYGVVVGNAALKIPFASSYNPVVHGAPGANVDDRTLREIFDDTLVWKQYSSKRHDPSATPTGLFHNKDLTSPAGFQEFADRTLRKTKALVQRIVNASTRDELGRVVQDLDRLSDLLCRVIDMSDFVRSTHPDRIIVQAAHEAYSAMFEYMNILNTTTGLYQSLRRALNDPEVVKLWSEEEVMVANILYNDFEKSGINLPESVRKKWLQLTGEIAKLGPLFANEIQPKTPYLQFESSRMKGMDPMVVKELNRRGKITLPTMGKPAAHALSTVEDPEVRKQMYLASHTSSDKQIATLEALLKRRAELAKLVGYDSFGQHVLVDKMARTPHAVIEFLRSLASANQPASQNELNILSEMKTKLGNPGLLEPWDQDFYGTKLAHAHRSRLKTDHLLSDYFSLGTVIQGLSRLSTRLYGVRLVPREPSPGETWNDDVRRLDVISESDGHIAVVYCDLFSRANKNPNPAHFTVRCSRRISAEEEQESALLGERADDGMASTIHPQTGELYQLPTIVLICNFSPPTRKHPTLLSFREVETLFHEMGHALHSILGRTALHNVAGTRCATDWAELPSVLMEHFAKDPSVLSIFARHWNTDAPLPFEQLAQRLHTMSLLEASETRAQILLALLDQFYHSSLPLDSGFDSTTVYRDVEREFGLLPHAEGTSWQGFFGHLYAYGATYYAYLFDRAIAARIWSDVFERDPLGREAGEKYKEEVLRWGGARSGWKCLAGVLRRPELENGGEEAMMEVGRWGSELK